MSRGASGQSNDPRLHRSAGSPWLGGPVLVQLFDVHIPAEEAIEAAAKALRSGSLVAFPTETVYGLGADATNSAAVAAVFTAKGRPRFNPLILHLASTEAAREIAVLGAAGEQLAAAFWPGPLTLVLAKKSQTAVSDLATAGLDSVAVRVPAHPVARRLLGAVGIPIAAPSANLSGRVSATRAEHVAADLGDRVAMILDAGPTSLGLESTIVALSDEPRLLRPGAISTDSIEELIGQELLVPEAGSGPTAPGMLASHYAPLVALRSNAHDVRAGESVLSFGHVRPAGIENAAAVVNLSPSGDLAEAAAGFFSALRTLDERGAPIAVTPIPDRGLGQAINDRLRRASAPRSRS